MSLPNEEEWRMLAAKAVARAHEFGLKYRMMPDGTLVLRSWHDAQVREQRVRAEVYQQQELERQAAAFRPDRRWLFLAFFATVVVALAFCLWN